MKITNIKQQVKRTDRYSIFVDGKYSFSLSESALLDKGLASGQDVSDSRLKQLKSASGADKAYGNALRYVALRPRSEWEVVSYLERKETDEDVGRDIIYRLKTVGLLDDSSFARSWINNRRLLKNTSKRRLRMELQQKRVPESIIDQALSEDDADEIGVLRELINKKQSRYPDKIKLMSYLARQGFGYDDIRQAIEQGEV